MASRKKENFKEKNTILKYVTKTKTKTNIEQCDNIPNFVQKKISAEIEKVQNVKVINDSKCDQVKELQKQLEIEKKKNEKLSIDLKKSVAIIKEAGTINLNKDIQMDKLMKRFQTTSISSGVQPKLFTEFNGLFDNEQLRKLRSISSGKSKDSNFVLNCMRYLYPHPSVLENRSVTGRQFKKMKKAELTPEKVRVVTRMLAERLNSEEGIDDSTVSQRLHNVKTLIRYAITKLRQSKAPVQSNIQAERPFNESNETDNVQWPSVPDQQAHNNSTVSPNSMYPYPNPHPFTHFSHSNSLPYSYPYSYVPIQQPNYIAQFPQLNNQFYASSSSPNYAQTNPHFNQFNEQ